MRSNALALAAISLLSTQSVLAAPVANPEAQLARRDVDLIDIENDVVNNGECKEITIIYGRGTLETGNVGVLTGPEFFTALRHLVGDDRVAVQGVPYIADIPGFLAHGSAIGSSRLAELAQQALDQCPFTKLVLSGYSQGAQLVHNAARLISDEVAYNVNSVVLFGDPNRDQPLRTIPDEKVLTICHFADNICEGGIDPLGSHLTYGLDADTAAAFVKAKAEL